MDDAGTVVPRGTVVIEDGLVADIVAGDRPAGRAVDCSGRLVVPGLINAHAHVGESLFRGAGGELGLVRWIRERSHPLMASLDDAGVRAAMRLAGLEMLRGGTTAFLDPEVPPAWQGPAVEAASETGLRATFALAVEAAAGYGTDGHDDDHGHGTGHHHDHASTATASGSDPAVLLAEAPVATDARFWIGPRVLSSVTPELGQAVAQACEAAGTGITFHCAEVVEDVTEVVAQSGRAPADFARSVGLLGPSTVIAHGVHLDEADLDILAETGTSIAHCPTSNAKLGSGIAPVVGMLERGINVALGTDGGMCNDSYDLLGEMRLAALFQKAARQDATALTPERVLQMATVGGARALGQGSGRLEAGAAADCVVFEPRSHGMWPSVDAIDSLVFGNARTAVTTVVIGGEVMVDAGRVTSMEEGAVYRDAEEAAGAAIERSGIGAEITPAWMSEMAPWLRHA
jgi:cytosine/adenosine deaminase-related metal-dependent hydrolase